MNGKISYWTIRTPDGWGVKRQGSSQVLAVFNYQEQAWKEARRLTGGKQEVAYAQFSRTPAPRGASARAVVVSAGPVRRAPHRSAAA